MAWYKSSNGDNIRPSDVDMTSSKTYVYIRKDFVLIPESNNNEQIIPEHWEYMENKIGEVYEGIVSGVTQFGIFVELENTVEGLIRFENLGNEYFIYDDSHKQLIGENTNTVYKMGDKITIQVIEANKLLKRVAFAKYDNQIIEEA